MTKPRYRIYFNGFGEIVLTWMNSASEHFVNTQKLHSVVFRYDNFYNYYQQGMYINQ